MGSGVTIFTPLLSRSFHEWMPSGLPGRTTMATTESVTIPFWALTAFTEAHFFDTSPALIKRARSGLSEKLTTSAGWPATTSWAWVVEAPKEFVKVTPDRKSTRLNSSHLGISYA